MLPKLPTKLNKREASITPKVVEWFKKNYPYSCAVEVKVKGGKLKDHQIAALKEVMLGTFAHKIADTGRRNPFDFFLLKNADAIVVYCDGNTCSFKDKKGIEVLIHI